MAKRKVKETTKEEKLQYEIQLLQEEFNYDSEPTYIFEVGTSVIVGLLTDAVVSEVIDNGKIYVIEFTEKKRDIPPYREKRAFIWTSVRSKSTNKVVLTQTTNIHLSHRNTDIFSLINKHGHFGVDFEPSYQRDFVWTDEDKNLLLDSIFDHIDIGGFVFRKTGYSKPMYEIIDGKQRLKFLIDFYEDRYEYKGFKFSDLSMYDQNHFLEYSIAYAEVADISDLDVIRLFVKLNTTGRVINNDHIEFVKKQIKELEEAI